MLDTNMEIMIIKTASFGLYPDYFLGKTIDAQIYEKLLTLGETHGLNVCGEGGEFESLTLDCPLYTHKLKMYYF
jgi:diphthine-ammonia ligase